MNAFNPLAYSKKLQEVGVPEAQAEVHAMALTAVLDSHVVTKDELKGEFARFEARYEQARVEDMAEWRRLLEQSEQRTTARLMAFETHWTEKFATWTSHYDQRLDALEHRLSQLEQKISELRTAIVKWLLLFWITQVGATAGLLAILR